MVWLKRSFESVGLTQHPVGSHLSAIQARYGGAVVLCLDVSGSMMGSRMVQACDGCVRFIDEAFDAAYDVGLVLWHHHVAAELPVGSNRSDLLKLLASATAAGGNDIVPTLHVAQRELADHTGDRVVAIFGDGDLGEPARAREEAARLIEENIRIITCGLGNQSAETLAEISTESRDSARAASQESLADDVASMASALQRR